MPPQTLVWGVDVHTKPFNMADDLALSFRVAPRRWADQYSVVMNARTGLATDSGVGPGWPEPLWKAGTVISLPPQC
ncbi:MAG TPA: hypothetical protein VGS19_38115 [Streptosporangiaceae bacterium]|nr:hypothetical protein [Streptosporangiaceae bacterium]